MRKALYIPGFVLVVVGIWQLFGDNLKRAILFIVIGVILMYLSYALKPKEQDTDPVEQEPEIPEQTNPSLPEETVVREILPNLRSELAHPNENAAPEVQLLTTEAQVDSGTEVEKALDETEEEPDETEEQLPPENDESVGPQEDEEGDEEGDIFESEQLRLRCGNCGKVFDTLDYPAPETHCPFCNSTVSIPTGGLVQIYCPTWKPENRKEEVKEVDVYLNSISYGRAGSHCDCVNIPVPEGRYTIHMKSGKTNKCRDFTFNLTPKYNLRCFGFTQETEYKIVHHYLMRGARREVSNRWLIIYDITPPEKLPPP